ncbi:MAG TPA: DoxX family protein [Cyclobacteriaceae bacterium]|nr:DoxX family protein [Cyclobacteriaceae bacterium]
MQSTALNIIRFAAAGNMLIHGIYRLASGGVNPFDGYLASLNFPPYSAWLITVFEIVAAIMIIMKRWVAPLSIVFIVELGMGIFLLHRHEGWFVVGGGRNGMEYSVLMIICFAATAMANWGKK